MASRFLIVNKSLEPLSFNNFTLNPGGSTVVESREMHNDPAYPKYLALQKITLVEYVESGITKEMNGKGMIKRGVVSATVPAVEDKTSDSTPEPSLTSKQEEEKAEEEPPAPVPPKEDGWVGAEKQAEPVVAEEPVAEPTPEPLPIEEVKEVLQELVTEEVKEALPESEPVAAEEAPKKGKGKKQKSQSV